MSQLVFEFGAATPGPVFTAVERVIGGATVKEVDFLRPGETTDERVLRPAIDDLISIRTDFEKKRITSYIFRPQIPDIRYVLFIGPNFDNYGATNFSLWRATIESLSDNYKELWQSLLAVDGLRFVCFGAPEGVELDDTQMTVDSFPWDEWPLVIGAVRSTHDSSEWVIRFGPEAKEYPLQ